MTDTHSPEFEAGRAARAPWPTCPECQQALEADVVDVTTEIYAAEHGAPDLRRGPMRCVTPGCPRSGA